MITKAGTRRNEPRQTLTGLAQSIFGLIVLHFFFGSPVKAQLQAPISNPPPSATGGSDNFSADSRSSEVPPSALKRIAELTPRHDSNVRGMQAESQNSLFDFGGNPAAAKNKTPAGPCQLSARYHLERGTYQGYLILSVELAPGAYIHSLTLNKELSPSVITVAASSAYQVGNPFHPDRAPTVIARDPVFEARMEKHFGQVQFFVPLEVRPSVDLKQFQVPIEFNGQVCTAEGVCMPLKNQIVQASFAGFFERTAAQSPGVHK
jgi:hypothetical protein